MYDNSWIITTSFGEIIYAKDIPIGHKILLMNNFTCDIPFDNSYDYSSITSLTLDGS